MYSTPDRRIQKSILRARLARLLLAGAAAGLTCGCANSTPAQQKQELSQAPLTIDKAMQLRDWDQSVAYYPNGSVPAWNTRFHYRPNPAAPQWIKPVSEPIAFIGQTLFLPITLVTARPFTPVIYRGVQEPSSSTAFPAPPDLTLSQQQRQQQLMSGGGGGAGSGGGAGAR
jgi:hypothetical protein